MARALQFRPRLLLLDEPTAALSAEKIRVLMGLIEQLKARGVSILMISHRFTDILHVCDRIVVVRQGQIAGELAPHAQSPERTMAAMHALMTGDALGAAGMSGAIARLTAFGRSKVAGLPARSGSRSDAPLGLLAILMLLAILLTFVSPYFLTTTNLLNIGKGAAVVGILAVGETIVIIAGGFDLSVGSTMAAAGMTAGYMVNQGVPLPLAFLAALLIGLARRRPQRRHHQQGADQSADRDAGDAVDRARPELRHLRRPRAGDLRLRGSSASASAASSASPISSWLLIVIFIVFAWAMPRTLFGRYAYAIGSSAMAAQRAGVPVARWRIAYYATCGVLSAVAGLVFVARTGNAQPSAGLGIELDVITAVILGGTSLNGGRGRLAGTFIGLILLGMIGNGLILIGVPAFWHQVVKGCVLLVAVLYDELSPPSGSRSMSARIGVIGCGWWATRAHMPALKANPDATIAGIADPNRQNRERAAERFGVPPNGSSPAPRPCLQASSSTRRSWLCRTPRTPNWRAASSTGAFISFSRSR